MCGIAGVASLGAPLVQEDSSTVERMLSALRHRGPDSRGILADRRCVFGNARLKIIDRSPLADMPMTSEDGKIWLTYNGEITNFRDLRQGLGDKYRFKSSSDTEVLLHLYEEHGICFLNRLAGMFAFSLYDQRSQKLFLVRDFYGLRPVYYLRSPGRLSFASEIKALMEAPDFAPDLDRDALSHYFSLGYIPGNDTPFKQIRELAAGHLLELDFRSGEFKESQYHRITYVTDEAPSERETAAKLRERMLDTVSRNLISDAPVGLTLSGGVDSSSLLALTRELGRNRDLHVFSLKIGEASFDESTHQKTVVDAIPCIHHQVTVDPSDILDNLEASVAYMDEPSVDGAAVPLFLLAKEAKKHVSVLLLGEGGDEIFNAYETHRAYRVREAYRKWAPAWLRGLARAAVPRLPASYKKLSLDYRIKRFVEGAERSVPESHFFWRHVFSDEEKGLLLPDYAKAPPTSARFVEEFERLEIDDDLNKISFLDLKYYFVDDLMVKDDRMVMAHSIEARYPYMDRPLVDFTSTIPTRQKVKGFEGRHIQKLAMKGLLPPSILRRQNMGLEMPHSIWFLNEFKPLADRYFSRKNVAKTELLNPAAVEFFWNQHLTRRKDYGRPLWCVLNFLIWFDLFVYNKDYKKHLS
jgi:asparagine synthase (glutamine-hydrolysing)